MGWAWHKLYPQTFTSSTPFVCPPNPYDVGNCVALTEAIVDLNLSQGEVCLVIRPPGGSGLGALFDCREATGPSCAFPIIPPTPTPRPNPGCPANLRLEVGLFCTVSNTGGAGGQADIDICDYDENAAAYAFYYATPSSPSSPPTEIQRMPLCLTYDMLAIPDRIQVISGFNRYRYGGYMAHGANCPAPYSMIRENFGVNPQQLIVGALPDPNINVIHGVTGISGMEGSLGRQFPLSDTVLTYPLFGGMTSANPVSSNGCVVPDPNPFLANPCDAGTSGHYASPDMGAQKGSFSFQCFNVHSYFTNDSTANPIVGIPTCSIWSLLHAIYYNIDASNLSVLGESTVSAKIKPDWWKTVNPTGLSADNTQMVRWVMNRFAEGVADNSALNSSAVNTSFVIPNVFLWDKTSFDSETTNANRWKHIYVVGNANIIMDTSCTANQLWIDAEQSFGNSTIRKRQIILDECNHKGELNSIHNARLLSWYACNPNGSDNPNTGHTKSSSNNYSMTTLNCIPWNDGTYCVPCGQVAAKECPVGQFNGHIAYVNDNPVPMDGCDPRA
jgi:hypothetical protein